MHEQDDPRSDAEHDALYDPELHDSDPDYYETEYLALPCTHIQGWTNQLPPCSVTAWSIRTRYYRPFVRLSRKLASSGLWRRRR